MATRQLKVLGVLGSPHLNGNADILLERAMAGVVAACGEHGITITTEKVVLATKKVSSCHYCEHCHKSGDGRCGIHDDMEPIYEQILSADFVIHSVPVWFFSMPGFVKGYLDRWSRFYDGSWKLRPDVEPKMRNKVFAAIAVCGDENHEKICEPAIIPFQRTAEFSGICKWAGSMSASAEGSGAITKDSQALSRAFQLGKSIVTAYLSK